MMPDIHALRHINHIFGHIRRVIANSLQVPYHENHFHARLYIGRVGLHMRHELAISLAPLPAVHWNP